MASQEGNDEETNTNLLIQKTQIKLDQVVPHFKDEIAKY